MSKKYLWWGLGLGALTYFYLKGKAARGVVVYQAPLPTPTVPVSTFSGDGGYSSQLPTTITGTTSLFAPAGTLISPPSVASGGSYTGAPVYSTGSGLGLPGGTVQGLPQTFNQPPIMTGPAAHAPVPVTTKPPAVRVKLGTTTKVLAR